MLINKYTRQDIQALRGFAVLIVILYHLDLPLSQNGFYGVDIFFVISGYVITQKLNDKKRLNFNELSGFYASRVRRLIPAAVTVILITTIISILIYPKYLQDKILKEAVCSILFISNGCFHVQGYDYLNLSSNKSPFLQFWSLAVEGQLYLIWPIIFVLLGKNKIYKILFLISFLLLFAQFTTLNHPGFSFYSPTSRAWEFLLGGIINLVPKIKMKQPIIVLIYLTSWILLFTSVFFYESHTKAPSINTLLFVIPTATLIYMGFKVNPKFKLISIIGDISYSLYLVHWPVIVIGTNIFNSESFILKIGFLVVTFLISFIISNTIEKPFRYKSLKLNLKKYYKIPIILIFFIYTILFLFGISPVGSKKLSINLELPILYANGCHVQNEIINTNCNFGSIQGGKLAMLVGDSHAAHFFDGINKASLDSNVTLITATRSGCPAALVSSSIKNRENVSCQVWQKNLIKYINEKSPDILFISNFTESNFYNTKFGLNEREMSATFQEFMGNLNLKTTKIFYVIDTPYPKFDSPVCLYINDRANERCDIVNKTSTLTELMTYEMSKNSNIRVINMRSEFCNKYKCKSVINGKNVFRDGSHISVAFSLSLWRYFLDYLNAS